MPEQGVFANDLQIVDEEASSWSWAEDATRIVVFGVVVRFG
jgi:hypothetical protein